MAVCEKPNGVETNGNLPSPVDKRMRKLVCPFCQDIRYVKTSDRFSMCLSPPLPFRRQHARVPVLILGVSIAEPLATRCAVYCCRGGAGPIARRAALAQSL